MPSANNEIFSGSSIIFRIPARLADVRLLGLSVHSLFANLGFNDVETYQLELAVTESANNIVKHAYQYEKDVFITMKFSTTDDRVTCTFVDNGKFKNFLKNNGQGEITTDTKMIPPDSRGIYIICDVMDEVSYRRSGSKNILTLVKYLV
jgi:serine/threonine-protein kinase RsbW